MQHIYNHLKFTLKLCILAGSFYWELIIWFTIFILAIYIIMCVCVCVCVCVYIS